MRLDTAKYQARQPPDRSSQYLRRHLYLLTLIAFCPLHDLPGGGGKGGGGKGQQKEPASQQLEGTFSYSLYTAERAHVPSRIIKVSKVMLNSSTYVQAGGLWPAGMGRKGGRRNKGRQSRVFQPHRSSPSSPRPPAGWYSNPFISTDR
jgi:hypothetical protein